ncbi:MAG TPA: organomercurial lyase [Candidatus Binatus sp.]|nr:organomercurial lyase [Candidatus Binatus sp.]
MTPADLAIRNATYQAFARLGRAPTPVEIGAELGQPPVLVGETWRRLHEAHALVLADPAAAEPALRMVNPFSAAETPHRVNAGGRTWFANCGWDAFGIGVVLRADSTIQTICPDCGDSIEVEVRGYRPLDTEPVFHVLVPARDWWSDIGFT